MCWAKVLNASFFFFESPLNFRKSYILIMFFYLWLNIGLQARVTYSFLFVCFLVFLFVCFFETRFLNIALDVLILRNPPASASQVLGLKPCTTTAISFPPLWPLYSPFLFKKINFWRSCKWIHTHMYTLPLTAQLNKEMIWYWIKNCTW